MYDINNKISPETEYRQKIFNEFIHFGYTKPRIKEYKFLRECEIAAFGMDKVRNTDINAELKNLLTAFSLQAYFKNVKLYFEVEGRGQGYFFAERFEYFLCKLISDCIEKSADKQVYVKIKILSKKIWLTARFEGKPIKNLSKNVYMFSIGAKRIINFREQFIPSSSIKQKPKEVYHWLLDRLSDVNLGLIDL